MHIRTLQRLAAIFAVMFILSGSFPVFAVNEDQVPEVAMTEADATETDDTEADAIDADDTEADAMDADDTEADDKETTYHAESTDITTISGNDTESDTEEKMTGAVPSFHAHLTKKVGAYTVVGTLSDLTPDMTQIETLYSLDGETWHVAFGGDWNLMYLDWNDESGLESWKSQPCLYDLYEPLKSYIAGKTDYFYVKLKITKKNGVSFETQSAVIEHGGLLPIPEGTERYAVFSSNILVTERNPFRAYGRYQLTVSPDATDEEVAALLPDTLPVEVKLHRNPDFTAESIVDCPVAWKPLSLPRLSPGESVTISDAAEEILVPAGTLITTPFDIFQLDEPLSLNVPPFTDEVQLVLNVSQEDGNPTGALWAGKTGLELSFHNKPTGAVSIKTYVITEGESAWTELSELSLSEEFNQPSTANSGYALVLGNDQEPYRSYLAARAAGETPVPDFVGLTIKGDVYDGRELVLPWPDSYESLPSIKVGGTGGNEGNAGAGNKGDGTENGQRPNLAETPADDQEKQQPDSSQTRNDDNAKSQQPDPSPGDNSQKQQQLITPTVNIVSAVPGNRNIPSFDESVSDHQEDILISGQPDQAEQKTAASESGQRPNLSQIAQDTAQSPLVVQAAADTGNAEHADVLSAAKTSIEQGPESNGRVPFLPVAMSVAAGICIAAIRTMRRK